MNVEVVFPVRNLAVQKVFGEGEDWPAEESETEGEADAFDDPVARCDGCDEGHSCQDAQETKSRCNQVEWRRGREEAAGSLASERLMFRPHTLRIARRHL